MSDDRIDALEARVEALEDRLGIQPVRKRKLNPMRDTRWVARSPKAKAWLIENGITWVRRRGIGDVYVDLPPNLRLAAVLEDGLVEGYDADFWLWPIPDE